MIDRRSFLKQSAGFAAMQALMPLFPITGDMGMLNNVGIQLFSLPKLLEKDVVGSISMLHEMGYTQLELYGPYSFSDQSAKDRWDSITPSLGFSGSGYFGKNAKEFRSILEDHGMTAPSMHTDLETLRTGLGRLAEAAHVLGHRYVGLPGIPEQYRKTMDDYHRMADVFNDIGQEAKKEGLRFAYHNHGYGIKPTEKGEIPLEILIDNTDPELVFLEMDVFWTTAGGADPVSYLKKYPGRYALLHVKDMKPITTFAGDGGDASQWIELFSKMTTVGDGEIDVEGIVSTGLKNGVEYFFVEQDMVENPEVALKKNIDFLKGL